MSTKKEGKQKKIIKMDGEKIASYFYRSVVIKSMFVGYAHARMTQQSGDSMHIIADEFIQSFFNEDDEMTPEKLVRNYYRFIPIYKEIIK